MGDTVFAGSVPQEELNAYYRDADLFLCMSEHEGFGIPLLESMAYRVPVLAYAAAAVPGTARWVEGRSRSTSTEPTCCRAASTTPAC